MTFMRAQVEESQEAKITKFLLGLNRKIQDIEGYREEKPRKDKSPNKGSELLVTERKRRHHHPLVLLDQDILRVHSLPMPKRRVVVLRKNGEVESESLQEDSSSSSEVESSSDDFH
ncbi:hypothetical protein CR513_36087, partial [Mucuna pruriens]